jgi:hypothetical protein
MEFDKKKCLELMKKSKKLREEGKFLWDYDKAKADELVQYLTLLDDDIAWQSRGKYFQILELFTSRSVTVEEFFQQYGRLRSSNRNASKMRQKNFETEAFGILPEASEIDFQLNPQSRGFTKILSYIDNDIDLFNPDVDLDMNLKHPELNGYGISEEFLRLDLKDNFLSQIGDYGKES